MAKQKLIAEEGNIQIRIRFVRTSLLSFSLSLSASKTSNKIITLVISCGMMAMLVVTIGVVVVVVIVIGGVFVFLAVQHTC